MAISWGDLSAEMGRELRASELKEKTVVLIGHDTCKAYATVWVEMVDKRFVAFRMGELNTTFFAFRNPDDTLRDDSGKHIRVYEFLGEVESGLYDRPN
jgi:hypothetical protein